jgi:hypothetical protein
VDLHIADDIGFKNYETVPVPDPDQAMDLTSGILDFLDDLLLVAKVKAHRFRGVVEINKRFI